MKNIKLIIEYDGTNYSGWQKQKNANTIQAEIEKAIKKTTGQEIDIIGCSRTDKGVHATNYVANFNIESTIPGDRFTYIINNKLPKDIVVISSEEVESDFHARYSCTGKTYCYTILNRRVPSAIYRNCSYLVKEELNIDRMAEACTYFKGTHDFEAFRTLGSSVKTTVRTIYEVKIEKKDEFIKIYASGDGFLYNMVRIMVGVLIKVGRGKLEPKDVKKIIDSKDRNKAGKVMPPMGLKLDNVFY